MALFCCWCADRLCRTVYGQHLFFSDLVADNIDWNAWDSCGRSPFMEACCRKYAGVVQRVVVQKGFDVEYYKLYCAFAVCKICHTK